ncbi:conserved hypothetical protein [Culex quinquefasciatus]|uniref:Uncharacterized protein n=1 Tax=Culex quinquefasciatus TaxID=7176 RepID=B0WXJ1_CULQU|nr:conserved hypothetical protein [Culex quinquefasciatus]|eukprot:XP_001862113.1 conserved hypothetical protein [Culex quinquefasciatus]
MVKYVQAIWQFIVRLSSGGIPIQTDIYLRDWSIKHELRNRAMIYDTGSSSSSSSTAGGSSVGSSAGSPKDGNAPVASSGKDCISCTNTVDSSLASQTTGVEPDISIRILRSPHCNRSEHLPGSLKACKIVPKPSQASTPTSKSKSTKSSSSGKHKKWPKTRHKTKGPPEGQLGPNSEGLAPLLVSNLLDKL